MKEILVPRWETQTEIAKSLGISSIQLGKFLRQQLELRVKFSGEEPALMTFPLIIGKNPHPAAISLGLAKVIPGKYKTWWVTIRWNYEEIRKLYISIIYGDIISKVLY
jgi:hypothetical protein